MFTTQPIQIRVHSRLDKRGFRIYIENWSSSPVAVVIPHPRERIRIYQDERPLERAFYPLAWQQLPPQTVTPKQKLIAEVSLVPYWLDVHGVCLVKCSVPVIDEMNCEHEMTVTEAIDVELPSREQLKCEQNEMIKQFGLENVPIRPTIVIVNEE